jgi:hypothetical protein
MQTLYLKLIRKQLKGVNGIHCLKDANEKIFNYSYFTILVQADYPISRDGLYQKLNFSIQQIIGFIVEAR